LAEIVAALASSHTPQLSVQPEYWHLMGENDPRIVSQEKFDALAEEKAAWVRDEITEEKFQTRHTRVWQALGELQQILSDAAPDVVVTVGDDQRESFTVAHNPAIDIYWGETVLQGRLPAERAATMPEWRQRAFAQFHPDEPTLYPCAADLGEHLIRSLVCDGFDISHTQQLEHGQRFGHAFAFVYRVLMKERLVPQVPVMINTYYPPNQPTAARCYEVGKSIGRAIGAWDSVKRVAVVASGGLSHFVVDEVLDRSILRAIQDKDSAALTSIPEVVFKDGTSEIKNWIAVTGALEQTDCRMRVVDYLPLYRSKAGTGVGAGFVAWQ
jgi:3-O-methylgallate 3,4-dioxygenase